MTDTRKRVRSRARALTWARRCNPITAWSSVKVAYFSARAESGNSGQGCTVRRDAIATATTGSPGPIIRLLPVLGNAVGASVSSAD